MNDKESRELIKLLRLHTKLLEQILHQLDTMKDVDVGLN